MPTIHQQPAPPRHGLTLAEVLVSIGILAIGLLGVASLFPVGGFYMQSGDVIDRTGAVAQSALDDAIIRGALDPTNWVIHDFTGPVGAGAPPAFVNLITGVGQNAAGNFQRDALRSTVAVATNQTRQLFGALPVPGWAYRGHAHGEAYVIDPVGLTACLAGEPNNDVVTDIAKSGAHRNFPSLLRAETNAPQWQPWTGFANVCWPVRRVTPLHSSFQLNVAYAFNEAVSREIVQDPGDLAQTQPEKLDDPARVRYDEFNLGGAGGTTVGAAGRQTRGDYSWLITVAPGSAEARDALAISPDSYPVDVSVVAFHRRPLGVDANDCFATERLVNARVVTTSTSGGELLLEQRDPASVDQDHDDEELDTPFQDFSAGDFVMLVGPHPQSTANRPRLFLQWYRVVSLDDTGEVSLPGGDVGLSREGDSGEPPRVLVGLRGPDWPWQPTNDVTELDRLSNDLRVAIIPGVAAVHTKTMRLESGSPWSVN